MKKNWVNKARKRGKRRKNTKGKERITYVGEKERTKFQFPGPRGTNFSFPPSLPFPSYFVSFEGLGKLCVDCVRGERACFAKNNWERAGICTVMLIFSSVRQAIGLHDFFKKILKFYHFFHFLLMFFPSFDMSCIMLYNSFKWDRQNVIRCFGWQLTLLLNTNPNLEPLLAWIWGEETWDTPLPFRQGLLGGRDGKSMICESALFSLEWAEGNPPPFPHIFGSCFIHLFQASPLLSCVGKCRYFHQLGYKCTVHTDDFPSVVPISPKNHLDSEKSFLLVIKTHSLLWLLTV